MDALSGIGGSDMVAGALALKQASTASQASVTLLDKTLEVKKQLAAQLLQTMGIGVNIDVSV